MNIIVCLDEKNGMLFNHRRQSQDRILRERIMEICAGHQLWMNAYSAGQFSDVFAGISPENIIQDAAFVNNSGTPNLVSDEESASQTNLTIQIDEAFLENAASGDFCFIENTTPSPYEEQLERIIIFRWNRRYPGDFYFSLSLDDWQLTSSEDFAGSSHKKITMETYERRTF